MKKILVTLMGLMLVLTLTGCTNEKEVSLENYLKSGKSIDKEAQNFMPELEKLKGVEDIDYVQNDLSTILFDTNSMTLIVKYDSKEYEKEKERLNKEFDFLEKSIAYLYYCDLDLDAIGTKEENVSMKKFIKDNFEYSF